MPLWCDSMQSSNKPRRDNMTYLSELKMFVSEAEWKLGVQGRIALEFPEVRSA